MKMKFAYIFPCLISLAVAMTENARLDEYLRRHYNWPPSWNPPTDGWVELMERREKQLMAVPSAQQRWDGWTVLVGSASLVKNFTEKGFKVVRAPESVQQRLHDSLMKNKDTARFEDTPLNQIDVIKSNLRPKFIDQEELNEQILNEMKPLFEEWSGVKLKPTIAYGLRIYQNESSLLMHVDKVEDHVISAILHVGHEYDNEDDPWPLVIESFDGQVYEVNLQPGDMLFYESAKCMHGRPRKFHGKYYSSIFIHYLPIDWKIETLDNQIMVPPHWLDGIDEAAQRNGENIDPTIPKLKIIGTGFEEPDCPDGWCALKPSKYSQTSPALLELNDVNKNKNDFNKKKFHGIRNLQNYQNPKNIHNHLKKSAGNKINGITENLSEFMNHELGIPMYIIVIFLLILLGVIIYYQIQQKPKTIKDV